MKKKKTKDKRLKGLEAAFPFFKGGIKKSPVIDFNEMNSVNGKLRMHVFSGKNYWEMARSFNEFFEKKDVELKEFHFVQSVSHDGFWIEDSVTVIAVFVLY